MRSRCRRLRLAAIVLLVTSSGCEVIVLGDSDSCIGTTPHTCAPQMWVERLQGRLDAARSLWGVANDAMPGMAAAEADDADGNPRPSPWNEPIAASFRVERLLQSHHLATLCRLVPLAAMAPRLVVALGTNDGADPGPVVVANIIAIDRRIHEAAPCVRIYTATIPPRFDVTFAAQENDRLAANAFLRTVIPPDRLLDFDTGFTPDDFNEDGVHLNAAGQEKRAEIAFRVLFPGLAS